LSLQQIRDEDGGFADGPAPRAIPMQRAKIGLAHQPRDAMLAASLSGAQIEKESRGAVNAMTCDERTRIKEAGRGLSPGSGVWTSASLLLKKPNATCPLNPGNSNQRTLLAPQAILVGI
jgi:hypothetical protein